VKFIIFNVNGKILRSGYCQVSTFYHQAAQDEFVMEGLANDVTQKIVFDNINENEPVNPRIINKTSIEIERDNPKTKPKSFAEKPVRITNKQLQTILNRIATLEVKHSQKEI